MIAGFDWDKGNLPKCLKHGVSQEEIEGVFRHPLHLSPDLAHSRSETRFLAIGSGGGQRPVFIVFKLRRGGDGDYIRPISARYMHLKERRAYEDALAPPDDG